MKTISVFVIKRKKVNVNNLCLIGLNGLALNEKGNVKKSQYAAKAKNNVFEPIHLNTRYV